MKKRKAEKITHAVLTENGQVLLQQSDGSYMPMGKGQTNFSKLDAMADTEIDYSEIPEFDERFFKAASAPLSPKKSQLTIRIDSDLLDWLKQQGRGYHTRINQILRAYMGMHINMKRQ